LEETYERGVVVLGENLKPLEDDEEDSINRYKLETDSMRVKNLLYGVIHNDEDNNNNNETYNEFVKIKSICKHISQNDPFSNGVMINKPNRTTSRIFLILYFITSCGVQIFPYIWV